MAVGDITNNKDEPVADDATELDQLVAGSAEPGVWRFARATRASVIIDAADYFALMHEAMLRTQQRFLLVGWDFDTRIKLIQGRRWWHRASREQRRERLGNFILWLARRNPGIDIRILKWSYGAIHFLTRGIMAWDMIRWAREKNITFNFDTIHPVGATHHQKIVILDDRFAVCGGIDMTVRRWDTREHLEHDRRRRDTRGKPYQPWHDATMMVEGDVAAALGVLGRWRWEHSSGETLAPVSDDTGESPWPTALKAQFEDVEIGIARTRGGLEDACQIDEIADLFEIQIASAKKFIYAESQYFASHRIANAIAKRLTQPDPPEIFIVHPANADGWLEQQAMDHARAELVRVLGEADPEGRFNLYIPYTGETPVYVHAKMMIVDDRIFRIGSANMNNRSLGLDSECDLFIDASRPGNEQCAEQIRQIRHGLLAEHCGIAPEEVGPLLEQHGSMRAMVDALGRSRKRTLRRYELPVLNAVQEAIAQSGILDPERPEELFETYPEGGLFREGSRLERLRKRFARKKETA